MLPTIDRVWRKSGRESGKYFLLEPRVSSLLAAAMLVAACEPSSRPPDVDWLPAAEELIDLPPRARDLIAERRRALAADPTRGELWLDLAESLHANGKPELAATAYETALRLDPSPGRAYYLHSHALREAGDAAAARARLEAWIEAGGDYPPAFRTRAAWALEAGELEAALVAAERVLELAPGDSGTIAIKGRIELAAGRYGEALATLSTDPTAGEGAAYRRFLLARARQVVNGKGAATTPVPEPRWSDPWLEEVRALERRVDRDLERASTALDSGDRETAIRLLEPLVAWSPDNPRALQLLALAHRASGDHAKALQLLEDAVERQPWLPSHLLQLTTARYLAAVESGDRKDFDRALATARRLQELQPGDFRGYAVAADVLSGSGEIEAALVEYRTCQTLARRTAARCEIKAAKCLLLLGRRRAAEELLRQTFGPAPADREAAALLAAALSPARGSR